MVLMVLPVLLSRLTWSMLGPLMQRRNTWDGSPRRSDLSEKLSSPYFTSPGMSTEDSQALLDYMLEPSGQMHSTPHTGKWPRLCWVVVAQNCTCNPRRIGVRHI